MMDIITVSSEIEKKINELEKAKKFLNERSGKKAEAIALYDKELAITILKIRNETISEFEGIEIKGLPATILEKVAKGVCFNEKLNQDKAEADYKSLIVYIKTTESQLNGWQSIYRYLNEK